MKNRVKIHFKLLKYFTNTGSMKSINHVIITEAQTPESRALISNSSFTMEKITTWQGFVIIKLGDTYVNLPNKESSSNDVSLTTTVKISSLQITWFYSAYHPLWWQFISLMRLMIMMEICDYTLVGIMTNVGNEVWICSINNGFFSSEILNNHFIF